MNRLQAFVYSDGPSDIYNIVFPIRGFFIPDEGGPDSYSEWCEEYHPNLTYSECAMWQGGKS